MPGSTLPETHDSPAVHYEQDTRSWIYRASALDNCTNQLIRFRMGLDGDGKVPEDMARRFADGHLHEASIITAIGEQRPDWSMQEVDPDTGLQYVVEHVVRKPEGDLPGIIIRGHTDGLAINMRANPDSRGVEAKAFSQANFDKAQKLVESGGWGAFFAHRDYSYYRVQLIIYMSYFDVPWFYGIKNKNSGEVMVFDVPEPPGELSEIVLRVLSIDAAGRAGNLLPECDKNSYPCPFWKDHPQYQQGGKAVDPTSWDPDSDWDAAEEGAEIGGQVDADGKPVDDRAQAELILLCEQEKRGREMEVEGKGLKDEAKRKIKERFLGMPGDDGKVNEDLKIRVPKFEVKWKASRGKKLNETAMAADGIDLSAYEEPWETWYPQVVKKKT